MYKRQYKRKYDDICRKSWKISDSAMQISFSSFEAKLSNGRASIYFYLFRIRVSLVFSPSIYL